ncbi:MAG: GntR family transcriptional regulator [Magnetovibrio sp.]|nr:GntR family transcriptional regulator [Magnetovibrio sp.]
MNTRILVAINQGSLGDTVYDRLSEALVKGRLRPNEKLTIRGLAETLGTSPTPVRDAIMRLIQDQALEQRSLRDVRVPLMTLERYLEIVKIRVELEGLSAEEATRKASTKQINSLKKLIVKNETAVNRQDWALATELNQTFHFALSEIGEMPVLRSILQRLWLQMGPLLAGYYEFGGGGMTDHHQQLVEAMEKRNPAEARRAITEDISGPVDGIKNYIMNYPDDADAAARASLKYKT